MKKPLAIYIIAVYIFSTVLSGVNADIGSGVSYLSSPPVSQVQLEEIQTFQTEIIEVPGVPMGDSGEVLQAQSLCSGLDVSSGTYVCSEFSSSTEVSGSVSETYTFSKNCEIKIIEAFYPAFYGGVLKNEDARVDPYIGEAPSLSDVTGNVSDVDHVGGESVPSETFRYANAIHNVPNDPDPYRQVEGSSEVSAYAMASSSNATNVGSQVSDPITVGDCPPGTILENPEATCDNMNKATEEWKQDNPWWCLPNGDCRSRPIEDDTTCILPVTVGGERACYQQLASRVINIQGILSDIECLLTNNCFEDVQLMIWTDPLMGKNTGCIEPCGDMQADAQVASTHPPDQTRTCSYNGEGIGGQNAPCWDDQYVGTWGRCSVCNREVPCMFVWKNTLFDEYERMKAEQGPCDPKLGDKYCTFWDSDYDDDGQIEEGYFPHIVRAAGGANI